MAKLIISNEVSLIEKVKTSSLNNGFYDFSEQYSSDLSVLAFNKLKVKNENFYSEDCSFISVAGSFLYKKEKGIDALKEMLNDFNGDVNKLRANLLGNYVFAIYHNDSLFVFTDHNNIFNCYYYFEHGKWAVSNNLLDLSKAECLSLTSNYNNIIEFVFQNTIINNETVFDQIKKLKGNECIIVNGNNLNVFSLDDSPRYNDNIVEILKDKAEIIKSKFDNITISMTGGLDSRVILASYLYQGVKPNLVYGVGNTSLTNTHANDLIINKKYEERFTLNFTELDWSTEFPLDKDWDSLMNKYGFLSLIYSGSGVLFSELENINTNFLDFGYFGETFRNIDWIEYLQSDVFTLDFFLDDFYINKEVMKILSDSEYKEYREHLYNKFVIVCNNNKLNPNRIHKNEFQLIHNEYRKGADTLLVNLVNYNFYSINLLSDVTIQTAVSKLSVNDKKEAKIIIDILMELYPSILEIPVFSHREFYTLKGMKLERKNKILFMIKKRIKEFLKKSSQLSYILQLVQKRKKVSNASSDFKIREFCKSYNREEDLKFLELNDVRDLVKYTQLDFILKNIKNSNNQQ